jgi:hypothetical protein
MAFELIPQSTPISIIPAGTAVGAPSTGATFAAPAPACLVTWQVLFGTAPGSSTIELQASNDGVNFTAIDNTTTTVTGSVRITASSARFLRAVQTAVAGGTTWQIIVSASPMGTGKDIYSNSEVMIGGQTVRTGLPATTAETTLFSMVINARSFITTGRSVKIIAYGTTGATGNTKTIRVKASGDATDVYTFLNGAVNNVDWTLEYMITRRSFGTFIRRGFGNISGVTPTVSVGPASISEIVPWTFLVTGQSNVAALDDIVLHNVIVTTIPGIPQII